MPGWGGGGGRGAPGLPEGEGLFILFILTRNITHVRNIVVVLVFIVYYSKIFPFPEAKDLNIMFEVLCFLFARMA